MPWLHTETYPLPEQDIVSFAFGDPSYDLDKPIYHDLDSDRTLSYNEGKALVRKLVAGFRAAGLKKGDCFALASFNDIMYSMLLLAGVGAGGIFSGCNPAYRPFELRHHIRTAQAKFFIVEPELLETVVEATDAEGIPRDNIFIFNLKPTQTVAKGFRSWTWLLEQGESDWDVITDRHTLENTAVARLTTSGTTGPPKMAVQSHFNATSYHALTSSIVRDRTPWEPRNLFPLPMFHVSTVPAVHVSPFRSGNQCWIMRRFELETFLAAIDKLKTTDLGMVPPLVIAIIMSPLSKKYSLKSVRRVAAGAAPLDAVSQRKFQSLCADGATFTQVWGMTETTSAISLFYWPDEDETGSVGNRFLPHTDVKLIDDEGNDITADDVRGECCVRGPTVIKGYFGNEKANKETFDGEGYLKSGDILYRDGKTKLWYIVDRKKELIKVRGFQVAPPELEGVLLDHPDIVDCAVIGLKPPTNSDTELVRAYVVRRQGSKMSEDQVKDVIKDKLASYKQLTGGVVFLDEVPKSPSGKILKRVLREEAEREGKAKL
ncbi:putative acyl-coenzyme A synthetase [Cyphellophora attinorum]|uniref:Putative acyl-coenzyme A synthetase n=1 Tax=Cyphellophora attinorum TaxID=1664694 RepID=A0A0N1H527_9EURO|nr:putative acyl-coenzyme A synthetase [Phialophora attinorum]KPI35975.1 putative acyl-coenzyme A synthetase [Phialophora attinorum]